MIKNRKITSITNLTNGPAKLNQSMQITKKQYGEDLTKQSSLYITEGVKPTKINSNPRIGIKNGIDKLWNFKIQV
jgi:DNA-3-methyladenine glycosylase